MTLFDTSFFFNNPTVPRALHNTLSSRRARLQLHGNQLLVGLCIVTEVQGVDSSATCMYDTAATVPALAAD